MPERLSIPIPKYMVYDPRGQGSLILPPEEVTSSPEYQEYVAKIHKKYGDIPTPIPTPMFDLSMLQETPEEFLESGTLGISSLKQYLPFILIGLAGLILFSLLGKKSK